jgi:Tfp pilus assembly protein PilF
MVHWKMLGRPDRAEPYFARVRKADPSQPVMLDFYREQYSTMGEPTKLVAILSDAQRRATTDADKLKLSLEIARVAQNDPQAGRCDRDRDRGFRGSGARPFGGREGRRTSCEAGRRCFSHIPNQ